MLQPGVTTMTRDRVESGQIGVYSVRYVCYNLHGLTHGPGYRGGWFWKQ